MAEPKENWTVNLAANTDDFKRRVLAYHAYLKEEVRDTRFKTPGDLVTDLALQALTVLDGGEGFDQLGAPPAGPDSTGSLPAPLEGG